MRLWVLSLAVCGAQLARGREPGVCLQHDRARQLLGLLQVQQQPPRPAPQPTGHTAQTLIASVLLSLLLASIVQVCRLVSQARPSQPGGASTTTDAPSPRRRCLLVELTVNRHARRESFLRHASSLDNSHKPQRMLGSRPVPLLRRSSFPVHPSTARQEPQAHNPGCTTPARLSRRQSMDASEGDSSPDTARKRVRIIRRH